MNYNKILFIAGFILIVIGVVKLRLIFDPKQQKKRLAAAAAIFISGIAIFTLSYSFAIVPSGNTGILIDFGWADNETDLQVGFNWIRPFRDRVVLIENRYQTIVDNTQVILDSADGVTVVASGITATYNIDPDASLWVYTHVTDHEHTLLTTEMIEASVISILRATYASNIAKRDIIVPQIIKHLQAVCDEKYGDGIIWIRDVSIKDIRPEYDSMRIISGVDDPTAQMLTGYPLTIIDVDPTCNDDLLKAFIGG